MPKTVVTRSVAISLIWKLLSTNFLTPGRACCRMKSTRSRVRLWPLWLLVRRSYSKALTMQQLLWKKVSIICQCSSVVRAFTHGAMSHRIDPSWWTHWAISRSGQWRLVYQRLWYVLSYLWDDAYKRTCAAKWKEYPMWRHRVSFLTICVVL